jgi:hypothetical protein
MKRAKLLAMALLPIALMLASCVIVPTNSHVNLSTRIQGSRAQPVIGRLHRLGRRPL